MKINWYSIFYNVILLMDVVALKLFANEFHKLKFDYLEYTCYIVIVLIIWIRMKIKVK